MAETKTWKEMTDWMAGLLERRTGEGVDAWKVRIQQRGFSDEQALRTWLEKQDVTGYAQSLLVMETFGYPEFLMASTDELIDGQYSDRPHLRPVLDAGHGDMPLRIPLTSAEAVDDEVIDWMKRAYQVNS